MGKQTGKHLFSFCTTIPFLFTFSTTFAADELTDTVAPEITLNGDSNIIIEAGNLRYRDAGVTTTDNTKDAISVSTFADVDTTKAGFYTVSYVATDSSGNQAKATRSIEVTDHISPEVTLNGNAEVIIKVGDNYSDAGVSFTDNSSGVIGITSDISINTNVAGEYTVGYTATDESGNKASISRKVVVAALDQKPSIIVSDDNSSVTLDDNRLGILNDSGLGALDDNGSVAVDGNNSISLDETTDKPTKGSGGSLSLYWLLLLGVGFLVRERKVLF